MDIEKFKKQLILHEDIRLKPYRDTRGKLTIGVGRNLDDRGITLDEAMYLLGHDIQDHTAPLDVHLPWWRSMNDVRQRVLADMCFNMGITGLLQFRNTLAAMENGSYARAAEGMRASRWYGQTKSRAIRLVKMMETGVDLV